MKNTKRIGIFVLAAILSIGTGCQKKNGDEVKPLSNNNIEAKPLQGPVNNVSKANNKLGFKLLTETYRAYKDKNTVVSPVSLSTVLSITQNGAGGVTKEEMLKAIELSGIDDTEINTSYKDIIANFNSIKGPTVKMANSIWIGKTVIPEENFIATGRNFYEADILNVDFAKEKTLSDINSYVSDHTAGKIKKVLKSLDPETAMILINTLYFRGDWQTPFKKEDTRKRNFTDSNGGENMVDMMHGDFNLEYLKGDKFSAIAMPYTNNDLNMYIFLPDKDSNVDNLIDTLSSKDWSQWQSQFKQDKVSVAIPKLHIEFDQLLNDMLKGFGMKAAFGGGADFSKISTHNDLFISFVKQSCFIDVDERGTEAAAATVVAMNESALAPQKLTEFTADHPYIYMIADKKSGLIMFMGTVENPQS